MSHRFQSPNVTPFIPPLPSPEGASPNHAPVLPSPNGSAAPPWAINAQTPAHFPIYPGSPYSGNPFIPPGSYFPPPTTLPPTAPNPNSGFSGDYTGYPQFTSAVQPTWSLPPAAVYPGTPFHGPQSAPPQGTWTQQARTPYVPFHAPLSAGAYAAPMYQGMPGVPQGWPMSIGPGPGPGFPPGAFVTPGPGVISHPHTPGAPVNDTLHYTARDGDVLINRFAVGDHYGPVLEPFLVRVVRADVKINPLLAPPDENVFLRWNMLFVSAYCQRSNDPAHVSWSKGRKEPATFPRVTQLRIVSSAFPWMISLDARNKSVGITCGEVIDGVDEYMHKLIKGEEYNALPRAKQKKITDAYRHNRAPAHGVPGGALGDGVRRLDWLCQDTMFGGIVQNDSLVTSICGDVLPCTFELKCVHRYPLSEREIQEQEERDRAVARERQRSRQSRVPTVEPASDDDGD